MKRAVLCVSNPQDYINQLDDYSIMIINPDYTESRKRYLLDHSDYSLLITKNGQENRPGNNYDNERLLWYTSGTVGDSKFYSFSQEQLDALSQSICNDYQITANDRYVGVMSLWHAHGQSLYWATRKAGCETHFLSVKEVRKMTKFQPTFISAIPDLLKVVHELPLESLRFLRSGSAPLSVDLYQALKEKFQLPIVEYFGMTEAMSHVLSNPLHGAQRPGTVGVPTAGVDAQILDGHLWIKSSQAYTKDWFNTGDLAEQDEQGYYRVLGRSVDCINIRGKKFNPSSLEFQVLKHITAVKECVIFGNHELNCLYVGDCDPKEILTFLLSLDPHLRPAMLNKTDEIPLQYAGKISRSYLKKLFNCK